VNSRVRVRRTNSEGIRENRARATWGRGILGIENENVRAIRMKASAAKASAAKESAARLPLL
jgi:hypothetical protein